MYTTDTPRRMVARTSDKPQRTHIHIHDALPETVDPRKTLKDVISRLDAAETAIAILAAGETEDTDPEAQTQRLQANERERVRQTLKGAGQDDLPELSDANARPLTAATPR